VRLGQQDENSAANGLVFEHRNDGCCAACCPAKNKCCCGNACGSGCGGGCGASGAGGKDANSILKSCGICNMAESESKSEVGSIEFDGQIHDLANSLA